MSVLCCGKILNILVYISIYLYKSVYKYIQHVHKCYVYLYMVMVYIWKRNIFTETERQSLALACTQQPTDTTFKVQVHTNVYLYVRWVCIDLLCVYDVQYACKYSWKYRIRCIFLHYYAYDFILCIRCASYDVYNAVMFALYSKAPYSHMLYRVLRETYAHRIIA